MGTTRHAYPLASAQPGKNTTEGAGLSWGHLVCFSHQVRDLKDRLLKQRASVFWANM